MVEPVNLFVVKGIVVELGMVMGLHKAAAGEVIDHGRNTGNSHGKSSDQVSIGEVTRVSSG